MDGTPPGARTIKHQLDPFCMNGTPPGDPAPSPGETTPPPAPPSPGPAPAGPPAAGKVLNSDVTEGDAGELVELRRKLSEAERAKKDVEMRNAQLEDENTRLRTPPPTPTPAPKKKRPLTAWEFYAEGGSGSD